MMRFILGACCVSLCLFLTACEKKVEQKKELVSEAEKLLEKCIAFHDPQNKWANFSAKVTGLSTFYKYNDKGDTTITERTSKIWMDIPQNYLEVERMIDGFALRRKVKGDSICESTWAKPEISAEDSTKQRLDCDNAKRYRNYYRYLIGLPMVLNDATAQLQDEVGEEVVNGKSCKVLTIKYEPLNKEPVWYFYIDTETGQLWRTKFVKPTKEGQQPEGEIIDFPKVIDYQQMKMLATFQWLLLDGKQLGDEYYTYETL